jgi:tetratricopeptide (TPR) repeat protein
MDARVSELLVSGADPSQGLGYIATLEGGEIEMFNFHSVQLRARTILNRGIREFQRGEHRNAKALLAESRTLNPENALVHWNLARCSLLLGEKEAARRHYNDAMATAPSDRTRSTIRKELREVENDRDVAQGPVAECRQ